MTFHNSAARDATNQITLTHEAFNALLEGSWKRVTLGPSATVLTLPSFKNARCTPQMPEHPARH